MNDKDGSTSGLSVHSSVTRLPKAARAEHTVLYNGTVGRTKYRYSTVLKISRRYRTACVCLDGAEQRSVKLVARAVHWTAPYCTAPVR